MFEFNEASSYRQQSKMANKLEALWEKHYSKCVVVCYWLLGLCNNFAYVIMLSAAHDILSDSETKNGTHNATLLLGKSKNRDNFEFYSTDSSNKTNKYDCND
jgi:hypothetical protein